MSDERETSEPGPEKLVIHDKRRIDPLTGAVRPAAAPPPASPPPATPPSAGSLPATPRSAGPSSAPPAGSAPFMGVDPAAFAVPAGYPGSTSTTPSGPEASDGSGGSDDGLTAADQIAVLQMEVAERTSDLQRVHAEYQNYRRRVERDRDVVRDLAVAGVVIDLLPVLDDIGRAADHGELVGGFKSVADALSGVLAKLGVELFGEAGEPFDPSRHEALLHTYSDEVTETTAIQIFQPGYRLRDRVLRPVRVGVADPTEASPPSADAEAPTPTD